MSLEEKITNAVPTSITASNAEVSAKELLNKLQILSNDKDWNIEACKIAGNAAINYSRQWNDAVIPAIEEEISQYQSEYDEKKSQYESAIQMVKTAGNSVQNARKDMDACMDYERPGGNWQDTTMKGSKKIIVDHIGYAAAKNREAQAMAEYNRYQAEMKSWEKQMKSAKNKMSAAEHKKKELENKIEQFILDVYSLNLMNDCAEFLNSVKNSNIKLSEKSKKTLFGRLFLLEHTYRTSFDKFQKIITESSEKYTHTKFDVNPDSLSYTASRSISFQKIEANFNICCTSNDSNSAELKYTGKKEFHVSKAKAEAAQNDISSKCKDYTLKVERSSFSIELDKKYENNDINSELDNLDIDSDAYAEECKALLEAFKANGASTSKFRIRMDKISNWHLNHWVKLWYKILFVLTMIILLAGIGIGGYFGISAAVDKYKYNKSFSQWMITSKTKTSGYHRYNFDDGTIRYFSISVIPADETDTVIKTFTENKTSEEFVAMTEEEIEWYKNLISSSSFVSPSSTSIIKIYGNFRAKAARGEGYFKVTADSEGNITEITKASDLGDFYYSSYAREKIIGNND